MHFAGMRCEAGTERSEPPVLVVAWIFERLGEGEENRGAAHVAAFGQDRSRFYQGAIKVFFDLFDDIAAPGVRENTIGFGLSLLVEFFHRDSCETRHCFRQLILELSARIDEADFFAVFRLVNRGEVVRLPFCRRGVIGPDRSGGAVTEKAKGDEYAGVIVGVASRRADFDGDGGDFGLRLRGEEAFGSPQGGNGSAAAKTDQVLEVGGGFHAEIFGEVT